MRLTRKFHKKETHKNYPQKWQAKNIHKNETLENETQKCDSKTWFTKMFQQKCNSQNWSTKMRLGQKSDPKKRSTKMTHKKYQQKWKDPQNWDSQNTKMI